MNRLVVTISSSLSLLALGSAGSPTRTPASSESSFAQVAADDQVGDEAAFVPAALLLPPALPPPPPPTPQEALSEGILIVVSIPSQRAFVFRKGELWDSSAVSTGKRGKDTPVGTFTILQKKKLHRSSLYDDAPMPYMQRLTWDGVALHAGRVPGYPASHGCIRIPRAFAEDLYKITNFSKTVVIVTDEKLKSEKAARDLV